HFFSLSPAAGERAGVRGLHYQSVRAIPVPIKTPSPPTPLPAAGRGEIYFVIRKHLLKDIVANRCPRFHPRESPPIVGQFGKIRRLGRHSRQTGRDWRSRAKATWYRRATTTAK